MKIEAELNDYISNNLLAEQPNGPIGLDENLLLNGSVDSLGVMQLVNFIEERFDITVGPGEVTLKNFKTINAMTTFISNKSAAAG
jgi:acyl carrier protein